MAEIEFDPKKNAINIAKHGISLERGAEMQVLFARDDRRLDYGEVRILAYGFIDGLAYCLCYAQRDDVMRAISLRRVHKKELVRHGPKTKE